MDWLQKLEISMHFIERYYERVFKKDLPDQYSYIQVKTEVFKDMISRLTLNEIQCGNNLCLCNQMVKIPFEKSKLIIVKDNTLITVLNNEDK